MVDNKHINQSGYISCDNHQVYYEDWGNIDAVPIMFLHGGPGGGCSEKSKELFNPEIHRVIFHDQRGSGRSTPFASTENNTTQHLIKDIESIRELLSIDVMYVTGGSWGSALSLFYTIAHPKRVKKLLIWSVFIGTQFEVDFVNEGYPRHYLPDEWLRFIDPVPKNLRSCGDEIMRFYTEKINSPNPREAEHYAREWTLWEYSLCSIEHNPQKLEEEIWNDNRTLAIARLETHYFSNNSFVPEGYILNNLHTIQHIPCLVLQGRFDMCTPPISSALLRDAYGSQINHQWVNSGHLSSDPAMWQALKANFRSFLI